MGYEVVYHYHERTQDGKWDMESRKTTKKKIGSLTEDLPLEKLAAIITTQLAKRDKLVVDVEVYEFVRKPVTFKEASDGNGIILKGKRFTSGDIEGSLIVEEVEEETPSSQAIVPLAKTPVPSSSKPVKRWQYFDPGEVLLVEARRRGLNFSVGKRYPVYDEIQIPGDGPGFLIGDDQGKQVRASDKYFVATNPAARVGFEPDRESGRGRDRLLYMDDETPDDMPVLRPNVARHLG